MLVYGICAGPSGKVDRIARPGVERADPDGVLLVRTGQSSIFEAYNSMVDEALALGPDVEGLVLLHDDLELQDDAVRRVVAPLLARDGVGLVGLVGGRDPRSLRWWLSDPVGRSSELDHELDFGGGEQPAGVVDGIFLALSPAAMRRVRFDERRFTGFHGYDADISRQVRAAGLEVLVAQVPVLHHVAHGKVGAEHLYRLAGFTWQTKWLTDDPPRVRAVRRLRHARARAQVALAERLSRRAPAAAATLLRTVPVPRDADLR